VTQFAKNWGLRASALGGLATRCCLPLRKVGDSPEWKKAMEANGLAPFNKVGPNFQDYVVGVMAEVQALSKELGVMK
jgi:hypothetical protein